MQFQETAEYEKSSRPITNLVVHGVQIFEAAQRAQRIGQRRQLVAAHIQVLECLGASSGWKDEGAHVLLRQVPCTANWLLMVAIHVYEQRLWDP